MNAIQSFNFNQSQVRVEIHNSEPFFCLADVTRILGINRRSAEAFRFNPKGCKEIATLTNGGKQLLTFISEPNLYRVIFRSNKTEAVKFQDWIFEEVIPQIRKTGGYQIQPKTTVADRTPLRQAVSALVGKCNIDYSSAYSMVHQRFGVDSIEEIAADKLPDAIAYIHALTLHSGLFGEVLDKQPAPSAPALDDETVLAFGKLLLHAQDMRLFVNRYLPAFQNLGIDGRGALWSFVHDTEPTFAAVRRFMTAQSVKSDFFARDWDWVRSRILSTARAF